MHVALVLEGCTIQVNLEADPGSIMALYDASFQSVPLCKML